MNNREGTSHDDTNSQRNASPTGKARDFIRHFRPTAGDIHQKIKEDAGMIQDIASKSGRGDSNAVIENARTKGKKII